MSRRLRTVQEFIGLQNWASSEPLPQLPLLPRLTPVIYSTGGTYKGHSELLVWVRRTSSLCPRCPFLNKDNLIIKQNRSHIFKVF